MCHNAGVEDEPLGPGDVNRPNGLGDMRRASSQPSAAANSSSSSGGGGGNGTAGAGGVGEAPAPGGGKGTQKQLGCRLLLDCMGHYSDIVKQVRATWRMGIRGLGVS